MPDKCLKTHQTRQARPQWRSAFPRYMSGLSPASASFPNPELWVYFLGSEISWAIQQSMQVGNGTFGEARELAFKAACLQATNEPQHLPEVHAVSTELLGHAIHLFLAQDSIYRPLCESASLRVCESASLRVCVSCVVGKPRSIITCWTLSRLQRSTGSWQRLLAPRPTACRSLRCSEVFSTSKKAFNSRRSDWLKPQPRWSPARSPRSPRSRPTKLLAFVEPELALATREAEDSQPFQVRAQQILKVGKVHVLRPVLPAVLLALVKGLAWH